MTLDRGSGAFLKKRLGGGKEVHCYGGSFTLTDASLKNCRLGRRQSQSNEELDKEYIKQLRTNIREKHSLRETLQRLEQEKKQLGHLDELMLPPEGGTHPRQGRRRLSWHGSDVTEDIPKDEGIFPASPREGAHAHPPHYRRAQARLQLLATVKRTPSSTTGYNDILQKAQSRTKKYDVLLSQSDETYKATDK